MIAIVINHPFNLKLIYNIDYVSPLGYCNQRHHRRPFAIFLLLLLLFLGPFYMPSTELTVHLDRPLKQLLST